MSPIVSKKASGPIRDLEDLDQLLLVHCTNGRFILCIECRSIIASRSPLYQHFLDYHRVGADTIKKLLPTRPDISNLLELKRAPDGKGKAPGHDQYAAPWPDGCAPVAGLPVHDAYECTLCPASNRRRITNKNNMRRHVSTDHKMAWSGVTDLYHRTFPMQTWYSLVPGGLGIWWRVDPTGPLCDFVQPSIQDCIDALQPRARDFLSAPSLRQSHRSRTSPAPALEDVADPHVELNTTGSGPCDEENPFLKQTEWPSVFERLPYWHAMRQLTYMPHGGFPLQLRDPMDTEGLLDRARISAESEAILQKIICQMKHVWQRCKDTFNDTPLHLRVWLGSNKHRVDTNYIRGFSWMDKPETFSRYTSHWNRLLCLLFRVCGELSCDMELVLVDIYNRLSWDIVAAIKDTWRLAEDLYHQGAGIRRRTVEDWIEDDWREEYGISKERELQERLTDLSIRILTEDQLGCRKVTDNVLVYLTGILSMDLQRRRPENGYTSTFIPVGQASSFLSSWVWIARVFALERVLPKERYTTNRWPSRDEIDEDPVDHLNLFREKYLLINGHSVIGEILGLKAFAKRVRDYDSARIAIQWSADMQELHCREERLQMEDFTQWIHDAIATARRHLHWLLGSQPVPTLPLLHTLTEDITLSTPGLSFITMPANKERLDGCTKAFVATARHRLMKGEHIRLARLEQYQAVHNQFLESLLVAIHTTGGQPARGLEVLSIKVINTSNSKRNIIIHQGCLCTLIMYGKTNAATSQPFYVLRALPAKVSHMLYQYLVYIRPFLRWAEQKCHRIGAGQPQYLWPVRRSFNAETMLSLKQIDNDANDDPDEPMNLKDITRAQKQGCWVTESLTKALRESCRASKLSMTFTTSLYRQIAISIARKHLQSKTLDQLGRRTLDLQFRTEEEAFIHKTFAWQAGHDIVVHMRTYGLDGKFPSKLQPGLLDIYHAASREWHTLLGIGSNEPELPLRGPCDELSKSERSDAVPQPLRPLPDTTKTTRPRWQERTPSPYRLKTASPSRVNLQPPARKPTSIRKARGRGKDADRGQFRTGWMPQTPPTSQSLIEDIELSDTSLESSWQESSDDSGSDSCLSPTPLYPSPLRSSPPPLPKRRLSYTSQVVTPPTKQRRCSMKTAAFEIQIPCLSKAERLQFTTWSE